VQLSSTRAWLEPIQGRRASTTDYPEDTKAQPGVSWSRKPRRSCVFDSRAIVKKPQVQALNQQGNLNEYFGVISAGGVVAPRKRKTYASKRLQEVVNDFREQRKRATETDKPDKTDGADTGDERSSTSSSESDVDMPQPPATKRGKARGGSSVGGAGKSRGRGGRGRGRAHGARSGPSRKRKRSVTGTGSSASESAGRQDLDSQGESSPPPPPSGTASRPRARPAFRGTKSQRR
jgi:DNA excision repair protein ERCC-5